MEAPERVQRYDKVVWETPAMDKLRREHCMCLHCAALRGCAVATELYGLCKGHGIALMVTRCAGWVRQEGSDI